MGVVITVMNMKGGVGKTTVATHLAGISARYMINSKPRKVLAIDYDPQFNMSQALLPAKAYFTLEKERKTTLSILLDDPTDLDPYKLQVPGNHTPPDVTKLTTRIYSYTNAHLDLIPSTLDLMYVALGQATAQTKPIEERFQKFISQCRSLYDVVFIAHRVFLCTVGQQLWDSFSSDAKKKLLAGVHGDEKKILKLDTA
jgi:chromosome partitioning protein